MGSRGEARRDGAFGEERMVDNFVKSGTLGWIGGEDLLDEFLDMGGNRTIVRELVFIITNTPRNAVRRRKTRTGRSCLLVDGLYLLRLERRTADNECVQNDANGPGVHFKAVTVCGVEEYFWSNVVRCTADSLLSFAGILD